MAAVKLDDRSSGVGCVAPASPELGEDVMFDYSHMGVVSEAGAVNMGQGGLSRAFVV